MGIKIAIGGDHAGFDYKKEIIEVLTSQGHEVKDFGPYSTDSCDYPDYVHPLAQAVESGEYVRGIVICGSANGVNMTANKYQGIRSAMVWTPEMVKLTRTHNDANVLALAARFLNLEDCKLFVDLFLTTEFEGGRHENRVNKIACS